MYDIKAAAKMYENNFSIKKISDLVGIPRETLRIKLISSGIKMRKSKRYMVKFLHNSKFEINPLSSELLALHAGDGCLDITGEWSFTSNKNDKKHVKNVVDKFQQVVGVVPNVNVRRDRIEIRSKSKQTTDYFSRFFPRGKKSHIVSLPKEIVNSKDIKILKPALRGLFSTDGCFTFNKVRLSPRIEFRVKSRKLRNDFVNLAKSIGFEFNFNTQKHWNGVIFTAYLERNKDAIEWMDIIGSTCDTHLKKYKLWKKLLRLRGSPSLVK